MTKEEYLKKLSDDSDFAPGWDAIEKEFDSLYPNQNPAHYGTNIETRAMFGGDNFLDGFSFYDSGKGWYHAVTFGMSELYGNEEAFGQEYSKWGYEMTMKLKADNVEACLWITNVFLNLARYTYQTQSYFDPYECIPGNGSPLHTDTDSKITALITVPDTTAHTLDTIHGKLQFIQLVGITESELDAIKKDINNVQVLVDLMKKDNPDFITDMDRKKSYL